MSKRCQYHSIHLHQQITRIKNWRITQRAAYREAVSSLKRERGRTSIAERGWLAGRWIETRRLSVDLKKEAECNRQEIRYKARLVAQGYTQFYGGLGQLAPVAKLRVLLMIAARNNMPAGETHRNPDRLFVRDA